MPRITVVTSVLNGLPYLQDMVSTCPVRTDVEHIFVDAGSVDGTLEFIKSIDDAVILERPGLPLYDAWNLAIAAATGDAILFLNSDDLLPAGTIDHYLNMMERNGSASLYANNVEAFEDTAEPADREVRVFPSYSVDGDLLNLTFGAGAINGILFRKAVFQEHGHFDTSYRFAADREFLLRAFCSTNSPSTCRSQKITYRYRVHDGSMTLAQSPARRREIALEHMQIVDTCLDRKSMSRETIRALTSWRAREAIIEVLMEIKQKCYMDSAMSMARLVRDQPSFLVDMIRARGYREKQLQSISFGRT